MEIKTVPVHKCPICGADGALVIPAARDYITNLPGSWAFRECDRCHSLWQDPCPLKEEIGKLYPENYHFTHSEPIVRINVERGFSASAKLAILEHYYNYENLAGRTGSILGKWFGRIAGALGPIRRRAGRTTRFLKAQKGARLLDVGCGNGGFLCVMQEMGWECEGVEPDPIAAAVAKRSGNSVWQGSVEDLQLPECHYDAVTMSHVMEHFAEPEVAMARIAKLLKPGGVFVSFSPNPSGLIRRLFGASWYGLMAPQHLVIPSANGYGLLCDRSGLHATCWTSVANSYWYLRETLSIRRTGATGNCDARLFPELFSVVSAMLVPIVRNLGEEVVCYAVKR